MLFFQTKKEHLCLELFEEEKPKKNTHTSIGFIVSSFLKHKRAVDKQALLIE
jgi:hypothetical protein